MKVLFKEQGLRFCMDISYVSYEGLQRTLIFYGYGYRGVRIRHISFDQANKIIDDFFSSEKLDLTSYYASTEEFTMRR